MDLSALRETDQLLLDARTGESRHLFAAQTGPDGEGARPSFLLRRPSSVSRTSQ